MNDSGHIPVWSGERVQRTNARGRHRYFAAFKTWIVEQALRPGMSTAGLAMRNQINANQLRRWMMLHNRRTQAAPMPSLLPVQITPEPVAAARAAPHTARCAAEPVEIEVAGVVVRVRAGVEPAVLRTVLDVLRGGSR